MHPQNMVERTFAILVLIFGLVLFSSGPKLREQRPGDSAAQHIHERTEETFVVSPVCPDRNLYPSYTVYHTCVYIYVCIDIER